MYGFDMFYFFREIKRGTNIFSFRVHFVLWKDSKLATLCISWLQMDLEVQRWKWCRSIPWKHKQKNAPIEVVNGLVKNLPPIWIYPLMKSSCGWHVHICRWTHAWAVKNLNTSSKSLAVADGQQKVGFNGIFLSRKIENHNLFDYFTCMTSP